MISFSSLRIRTLLAAGLAIAWGLTAALAGVAPAQAAISPGATITTNPGQLFAQYGSDTSPDGNVLALPSSNNNTVTLAYADTHSQVIVADPSSYLHSPHDVAFSPDGLTLYVANSSFGTIAVIDVETATVVDAVATFGSNNLFVDVSPDGTRLVVTDGEPSVTVFDITNGFADINREALTGQSYVGIFFPNNIAVYVINSQGLISAISLSDGSILESWSIPGIANSMGQCATADLSVVVAVSDDNYITSFEPASGNVINTLDLSNVASGLALCEVSAAGTLVVTDWSFSDGGAGHVFVIDLATLTLEDTVVFPDVEYTAGVGIMTGCEVFAGGSFTNIGTFALPESDCVAPTPDPALPDTGASQGQQIVLASVGGGLVILGVMALASFARRRPTKPGRA